MFRFITFSRTLMLLLCISIILIVPQSANASGVDKILELKGYIKTAKFDLISDSLYPDYSNPYSGSTTTSGDDIDLIPLNLRGGVPYVFYGSQEFDYCYDMQLQLLNEKGQLITESKEYTANPLIQVTPSKTGIYQLVVATPNHARNANFCSYSVTEYSGN